ncbi:hypothetical protein CERSUDRAFT_111067 [Gelatoporia subvermispora B]|uniref:Uncharacterized protein n=1 Tax=Ceriporiopsis subvermispora (strain B) TaxID=914234 RepID=M2PUQ4_CERS8|nr:hypothetical protein CERSUDRAFT_111067 [Gelatoporia subvermispora B]
MRRTAPPRLNRLPQRLDYQLIPAPLDLSRPLVDEKSALPAIIVTPSSPSHEGDFCIAFLSPPPKPTLFERLSSAVPALPQLQAYLPSQIQLPQSPFRTSFDQSTSSWSPKARARTVILLMLLLFIMACHVVLHSLAGARPHFDFAMSSEKDIDVLAAPGGADALGPAVDDVKDLSAPAIGGWFNLHALWAPMPTMEGKRETEFIVWESPVPSA